MENNLPLSGLIEGTLKELERLQYTKAYARHFRHECEEFSQFAEETDADDTFSEELGAKFLKQRYNYPLAQQSGPLSPKVRAAIRCVRRLGEYQLYGAFVRIREVKPEYNWSARDTDIIEAYAQSVQTADNSAATKKLRIHHIKLFYDFMGFRGVEKVTQITPELISGYVLSLQGGSLVYAKHRLSTLKYFFRFIHANGYCETDFSYAVPRIKAPKNQNVPALWSKDEISRLMESIDRGSPSGKRDYAVLSLAIQLGIRISDIANLKLENLKWERKEIEFSQHKTGKRVIYPMLNDIGWAVIDYLRYGRPESSNSYLFLSCNAPYTNLQSGSMSCILYRQMQRCGIKKREGTVSGMHSLRHALARSLLEQNTPLSVLADIMGHASVVSASPYLKVDIDGLRDCALSLGRATS